jgi:hypothetical protein
MALTFERVNDIPIEAVVYLPSLEYLLNIMPSQCFHS